MVLPVKQLLIGREQVEQGVGARGPDVEGGAIAKGWGEKLQPEKALENKQIEPEQSEFYRIPSHTKSLTDEQVEDVVNLIEKMEEDEDVLNVFHNMDMN